MKRIKKIDNILVPVIRREFPELLIFIDSMLAPSKDEVKFIFSIDSVWTEEEKRQVKQRVKRNPDIKSNKVFFISCNIDIEKSVYIRDYEHYKKIGELEYGMKSGPNIQFFKNIKHLIKHKSGQACILCEVDTISLTSYWLDKIVNECKDIEDFYIAGSKYCGVSDVPKDIIDHINGNAVINYSNEGFEYFFELWEKLLIKSMRHAPWHAYDVISEWMKFNKNKVDGWEVDKFLEVYSAKVFSIKGIVNLAGKVENGKSYLFEVDKTINKYSNASILHLRKAIPYTNQIRARINYDKYAKREHQIIAYDNDWQYPAITEKHAYIKIKELLNRKNNSFNSVYFAFPWATMIDLLKARSPRGEVFIELLNYFKKDLLIYKNIITTCQHIYMLDFLSFYKDLGVTDIFWSHCTKSEFNEIIKLHPFPLYPVQQGVRGKDKIYICSFVGSKPNGAYLNKTRFLIFDNFKNQKDMFVKLNDQWFYQKVVYDKQIELNQNVNDNTRDEKYLGLLEKSSFSLCPSGSGPNSIRLWESIHAGSVPVVLSDSYLPPVDKNIWADAIITCKEDENEIESLPSLLKEENENYEGMEYRREMLKQISMLYGPEFFIYDILKLFLKNEMIDSSVFKNSVEKFIASKDMEFLYCVFISRLLLDSKAFNLDVTRNNNISDKVKVLLNRDNNNSKALSKILNDKGIVL